MSLLGFYSFFSFLFCGAGGGEGILVIRGGEGRLGLKLNVVQTPSRLRDRFQGMNKGLIVNINSFSKVIHILLDLFLS